MQHLVVEGVFLKYIVLKMCNFSPLHFLIIGEKAILFYSTPTVMLSYDCNVT